MDRMDRCDIMGHTTQEAHELYSAADIASLRREINKHSPSSLLAHARELGTEYGKD